MNTKEVIDKRFKLMEDRYGSVAHPIHTPEAKIKAAKGRISKSLSSFPELSIKCKLINTDSRLEIEGTVYDISLHLYGYTNAVRDRNRVLSQLSSGRGYISGKWKGYKIIKCNDGN